MIKGPPSTIDPRVPEYYQLSERITKTRRGRKNDGRPLPGKAFADHDNPDTCPVRTLLFFEAKKTDHQNRPDGPFLLTVGPKAEREPDKQLWWFVDGPMGKHLIGDLLKEGVQATGSDISHLKITARSARKTMCQAAADSICSPEFTSKVMGHKSLDSKLNYMKVKDPAHKATSLAIGRTIAGKSGNMFADLYSKTLAAKEKTKPSATVTSSNCEEETVSEKVEHLPIQYNNQPLQVLPQTQQFPSQGQTFAPVQGYGQHPPFIMASPQQFYSPGPGPFYQPQQFPPFYPHPAMNMMPPPMPMYHNPGMYMQGPPRQMMVPVMTDVTNHQRVNIRNGEKPKALSVQGGQCDQENINPNSM